MFYNEKKHNSIFLYIKNFVLKVKLTGAYNRNRGYNILKMLKYVSGLCNLNNPLSDIMTFECWPYYRFWGYSVFIICMLKQVCLLYKGFLVTVWFSLQCGNRRFLHGVVLCG